MAALAMWILAIFIIGYFIYPPLESSFEKWWSDVKEPALKEARWRWYAFLKSDKIAGIMRDSHCSKEDVRVTFEDMVSTGTDPARAIEEISLDPYLLE